MPRALALVYSQYLREFSLLRYKPLWVMVGDLLLEKALETQDEFDG